MTDIIGQLRSPLHATHINLGATMTECEGWSVPANYGDVSSEYATVREGGAGLIDLSSRGRISVSGSEAIQFLNGLITNDMKTLEPNSWMPAAFPNVQGRLIASVRIIRAGAASTAGSPVFLLDTESATQGRVLKTIERFTLAGDFRVTDVTKETALLSLQGKRAAEVIQTILGDSLSSLPFHGANVITWQDAEVTVIRASHTGENGYDLILSTEHAARLWESLINEGAQPVGYDALEVMRIEAGIPRYGVDMDETNVVTETSLDDAVSFTKGCYVGQEIIARIKYRGHVAKRLTGLAFHHRIDVQVAATLKSLDQKEIGRVTSVTWSPQLNQTIALGYLKYDYLLSGTEVMVAAQNGDVSATVIDIPFVKDVATVAERGA